MTDRKQRKNPIVGCRQSGATAHVIKMPSLQLGAAAHSGINPQSGDARSPSRCRLSSKILRLLCNCSYLPKYLENLIQFLLFNPPPPGLFLYPPQPGGGGGVGSDPPAISKTDGRRETDEAEFERSRRDASKPLSKIQNWGHVSGQGQVKGQNRVFSGCRP